VKLIEEWRVQLNRVWTIRWAILGALLASADQILAAFVGQLPPVVYAVLFVVILVARLIYQPDAATKKS
jgi:hypothetical protein